MPQHTINDTIAAQRKRWPYKLRIAETDHKSPVIKRGAIHPACDLPEPNSLEARATPFHSSSTGR